jgi:hypothetical protein
MGALAQKYHRLPAHREPLRINGLQFVCTDDRSMAPTYSTDLLRVRRNSIEATAQYFIELLQHVVRRIGRPTTFLPTFRHT